MIFHSVGNLYGAAGGGCIESCNGTIFKLSPNQNGKWTESIIHTFLGGTNGSGPNYGVIVNAGPLRHDIRRRKSELQPKRMWGRIWGHTVIAISAINHE